MIENKKNVFPIALAPDLQVFFCAD